MLQSIPPFLHSLLFLKYFPLSFKEVFVGLGCIVGRVKLLDGVLFSWDFFGGCEIPIRRRIIWFILICDLSRFLILNFNFRLYRGLDFIINLRVRLLRQSRIILDLRWNCAFIHHRPTRWLHECFGGGLMNWVDRNLELFQIRIASYFQVSPRVIHR